MKKTKLTNTKIATENIRRRPFRTIGLIISVALFALSMMMGLVILSSLTKGVRSLSDRLGADVIVVPQGYQGRAEDIFLTGGKNDFYIPDKTIDKLNEINGIEKITPQLYIATLKASCCSYPVQIIGYDEKTDFIIKPWLEKNLKNRLKDNEVVFGAKLSGNVGDEVKFFNNKFKVVGRLEKTGMGFDTCVFMNMNTAKNLAIQAERIKKHPVVENRDLVSAYMIKVKTGYSPKDVATSITRAYSNDGIYGIFSKNFVNQISSNLTVLSTYIKTTILILWVLSIIIMGLVFALIIKERRREMNIMRVMGATQSKIISLIVLESFIVSLIGAVIGTIIGGIASVALLPVISKNLNIPYLFPTVGSSIIYVLITLVLSAIIGPINSFGSALAATKSDTYTSIRRG